MQKIYLLILFTIFTQFLLSQGWHNHDLLLINRKVIQDKGITAVIATTPDSYYYSNPLSKFVFSYSFDSTANVINKKYWRSDIIGKNSKFLDVTLVTDSGYYYPELGFFCYKCLSQSQVGRINQLKSRTNKDQEDIFEKFNSLDKKNCKSKGFSRKDFIKDTILLNKNISVPLRLIPTNDSLYINNDTIFQFNEWENDLFLARKYYLVENNSIKIDVFNRDSNNVWRSYFINSKGLLEKETQNIYTTFYYFDDNNLHIKTESFINDYLTHTTIFKYETQSR